MLGRIFDAPPEERLRCDGHDLERLAWNVDRREPARDREHATFAQMVEVEIEGLDGVEVVLGQGEALSCISV